jgi:Type III secretion basal body protein I, YscI, HrpB, PscI
MVAPIGVGKAATAVAESAEKLGGKGAGAATDAASEQFEQLLEEPAQAGATTAASQIAGATAAGGQAAGSAMAPTQVSALQAKATDVAGPGDKILRGIDQVRGEADQLVQRVSEMSEAGGPGKASDLLSMQASLMDFEVTTQVGGKAMQESNQAVQTLLKGQ